MRKHN